MRILLGLTGSVATTIAPKIIAALEEIPGAEEVRVVMTDRATMFYNPQKLQRDAGVRVYTERDEWIWEHVMEDGSKNITDRWTKGDPVLHIELMKWASVLVIAPATANTIAKMVQGICDNLLTSIYLAWDSSKPVVIAPAMNSFMWNNFRTVENVHNLKCRTNTSIVYPVNKTLACGDVGVGALATAETIAEKVRSKLQWAFPVRDVCPGIPIGTHPGSFGAVRKKGFRHCGGMNCSP